MFRGLDALIINAISRFLFEDGATFPNCLLLTELPCSLLIPSKPISFSRNKRSPRCSYGRLDNAVFGWCGSHGIAEEIRIVLDSLGQPQNKRKRYGLNLFAMTLTIPTFKSNDVEYFCWQ